MANRLFRFKRFSMTDEHCGMRIGTDGVLLGAWAHVDSATLAIADIGCGCGIIALMLMQRAQNAVADAVECDAGAITDAGLNFKASPWADRLVLHAEPFENFRPAHRYNLVASNPPFFTETLKSPDCARAAARHAGTLSFESLAARASELLVPDGRLAVILPAADDEKTLLAATLHKLHPCRHCSVSTSPGAAPIRSLWEFSLKESICRNSTLCIHDRKNGHSPDYIELTKAYHPQL